MMRGNLAVALASLGKLEQVIDELGTLPRKLAVEAAPKLTRLLQRQFAQGVNPYGRTWARLASGKRSHLTRTGKLRAGTRATPMLGGRMGVRLVVGARYGAFHQTGTRNMPARKILPDRGLPRAWRDVLDASALRIARRAASRLK